MDLTGENLSKAFAGESQANRKYLAFAIKAEEEGYHQVARLFRAAAAAETVHAHNHLREMGEVKSTEENLKAAIGGESYEFQEMYPQMIEVAIREQNLRASRSFTLANEVEKIHASLYSAALAHLGNNSAVEYYVCQVCGNTVEGEPPDECPICKSKKRVFKKID